MGDYQSIHKLINEDLEKIVVELRKHEGKTFSKAKIKNKFELPNVRGSLLFNRLKDYGFIVKRFTITIPHIEVSSSPERPPPEA